MERKASELELKIEKLNNRVAERDFQTAKEVCDKIEFKKIKDSNVLSTASTVYEKNREFEKAEELLKRAYRYSPVPKRLLYDLSFICIESGNLPDAIVYYKEFCDNFPTDQRRELLKYGILKRKGAKSSQLIRVLEDYLSSDLDERWLFELALQYEKEENTDALILCCDKIVDTFGLTEYGQKALQLKQKYTTLSEDQKILVENKLNERKNDEENTLFDKEKELKEKQEKKERALNRYENEVRKDLYTFDKKEDTNPKDITPPNTDETNEEKKEDNLFNNFPKTNVGVEDKYIPDTDEYFKNDLNDFASAFANSNKGSNEEYLYKNNLDEDVVNEYKNKDRVEATDIELRPEQENETAIIIEENKNTDTTIDIEKAKEEAEKIENEKKRLQEEKAKEIKEAVKRKSIINLSEEEKDMRLEDLKVNMIIEAMSREAGIKIATSELGFLRNAMGIKKGIAKTSAYNINEKGFAHYKEKIGDNDFVIENAGRLNEHSIDDIEEFVINNGNENIICLIDIMNNFDEMLVKRPAFINRFDIISDVNVQVEVPKAKTEEQKTVENSRNSDNENTKEDNKEKYIDDFYDRKKKSKDAFFEEMFVDYPQDKQNKNFNDDAKEKHFDEREVKTEQRKEEERPKEYVNEEKQVKHKSNAEEIEEFASMCRNYATSIDCVIPGKSMPALYAKIEKLIKDGVALNQERAVNIIEAAADKAEKPKFGFSKKYDKNDCLILKEEHFV